MTREATDNLYIELGYYDPEEYYVYVAEAESQQSTASTLNCQPERIQQAAVAMTVTAAVSATISHIEGADMFAFSDAQLAAAVDLIRDSEITAASTFSVAIDFLRQRDTGSDQDAVISAIIAGLRSRDVSLETQAAFSLVGNLIKTNLAESSLSINTSITAVGNKVSGLIETFSDQFSLSTTPQRIRLISGNQSSTISLSANGNSIVDISKMMAGEFTQNASAEKTVDITKELAASTSLFCVISHFEGSDMLAFTSSTLSVDVNATISAISSISSSASLTAIAQSQRNISATEQSLFSIIIDAGQILSSQQILSSTTAFTASGIISNKRPRQYTVNSVTIDTSVKKFGLGSALFNSDTDSLEIPDSTDWNSGTWKTIDLQFYVTPLVTTTTHLFYIEQYQDASNYWRLEITSGSRILSPQRDIVRGVRFVKVIGGSLVTNIGNTALTTPNIGQWNHLRVVDDGSIIRFWVNGSRVTNSETTYSNTATSFAAPLTIGPDIAGTNQYLDELLITKEILTTTSTTSFTAPTARYYPTDQSQILVLSHFDTDFSDDLGIAKLAAATLSANASLTATATTLKSAQANLTATATLSSQIGKIILGNSTPSAITTIIIIATEPKSGSSDLFITTTVTIDAVKTTDADSDLSSTAAVDSTAYRIKQFAIDITDAFIPTVDADAQLAGVALLESQSQLSIDANYQVSAASAVTATATVTATVTQSIGIVADLTAESAMTTDNVRVRYAESLFAANTTQSVSETYLRLLSASITSTATVESTATRFHQFSSDISSEFTQSTQAVKTTDINSSQSSAFTETTQGDRSRSTAVSLTSESTADIAAVKTPGFLIAVTSAFTETTLAVKTTDSTISAGALFTPTIDADAQLAGVALLETTASLSLTITRITEGAFGSPASTGLANGGSIAAPLTSGTSVSSGFTVSFWNIRESLPSTYRYQILRQQNVNQPAQVLELLSGSYDVNSGGDGTFTNALRLSYPWDADEPYAYWDNSVPNDLLWHHYLIRLTTTASEGGGTIQTWRLWVDGVEKTQGETQALNNSGPFWNITAQLTPGNGALAQIWGGTIIDGFAVDKFYDGGFVDLYEGRGYANQLPTPDIYNRLSDPWTGVTGEKTASPIPLYYPGLRGEFLVNSSSQVVFVFAVSITATTSLTTTAQALRQFTVAVSSESSIDVVADTRIGVIATVTSESTVTALVGIIYPLTSTLESESTVYCLPGYVEQVTAEFTAESELIAGVDVVPPTRAQADLIVTVSVSADVSSFTDSITLMTSFGELTADVTLIPPIRAEANLQSEFTVTATIGAIEQFAVLTASAGTVTAEAARTRDNSISATVDSGLDCTIGKITGYSSSITALYSTLTVGDVINIDAFRTLKIEPESRTLVITAESRQLTIEQETRTLIIEGWE